MTGFLNPALKQLTDQQVRFAPAAKRREQRARAEKLLAEVEPGRKYPYQYVVFRVTEFRPDSYPDLLIDGSDLLLDLRQMTLALTDTVEVVPETAPPEPVVSSTRSASAGTSRPRRSGAGANWAWWPGASFAMADNSLGSPSLSSSGSWPNTPTGWSAAAAFRSCR